jgi:hypothetical protein
MDLTVIVMASVAAVSCVVTSVAIIEGQFRKDQLRTIDDMAKLLAKQATYLKMAHSNASQVQGLVDRAIQDPYSASLRQGLMMQTTEYWLSIGRANHYIGDVPYPLHAVSVWDWMKVRWACFWVGTDIHPWYAPAAKGKLEGNAGKGHTYGTR